MTIKMTVNQQLQDRLISVLRYNPVKTLVYISVQPTCQRSVLLNVLPPNSSGFSKVRFVAGLAVG